MARHSARIGHPVSRRCVGPSFRVHSALCSQTARLSYGPRHAQKIIQLFAWTIVLKLHTCCISRRLQILTHRSLVLFILNPDHRIAPQKHINSYFALIAICSITRMTSPIIPSISASIWGVKRPREPDTVEGTRSKDGHNQGASLWTYLSETVTPKPLSNT